MSIINTIMRKKQEFRNVIDRRKESRIADKLERSQKARSMAEKQSSITKNLEYAQSVKRAERDRKLAPIREFASGIQKRISQRSKKKNVNIISKTKTSGVFGTTTSPIYHSFSNNNNPYTITKAADGKKKSRKGGRRIVIYG